MFNGDVRQKYGCGMIHVLREFFHVGNWVHDGPGNVNLWLTNIELSFIP